MEWEDCVREKRLWEEDYAQRRQELDAKWAGEVRAAAERGEWRRLNRTDKERFLDPFVLLTAAGRRLVLEQGIANCPDALGLTVWDASLVMVSYLERQHEAGALGRGTTVLEVGSGCGVVAITAAAALGADVTATDQQWVIPLTTINVEKNGEAIASAGGSVICKELVWGRKSDWEHLPAFDYIVAADCIYTDTSVPELLRTVHAIAGKGTIVIFAFQEHNPDAARKFWTTVDDYFSFERVGKQFIEAKYWDSGINLLVLKKKELPQK